MVDISSGIQFGGQNYYVDALNRPIGMEYADGSATATSYSCCGPDSTTERDGTVTTYTYDAFGDQIQVTDAQGHITTNTYDANGNKLTQTQTRTTSGGLVALS